MKQTGVSSHRCLYQRLLTQTKTLSLKNYSIIKRYMWLFACIVDKMLSSSYLITKFIRQMSVRYHYLTFYTSLSFNVSPLYDLTYVLLTDKGEETSRWYAYLLKTLSEISCLTSDTCDHAMTFFQLANSIPCW